MLGEFEQVVLLAILRVGDDAYGVPVCDEIRSATGREVTLGALYKTLARLEEKRLVRSRIGDPTPQRGGRRKRHYVVTAAGRRALQATFRTLRTLAAGLELGLDLS